MTEMVTLPQGVVQRAHDYIDGQVREMDDDCGDPACDECANALRPATALRDALRAALAQAGQGEPVAFEAADPGAKVPWTPQEIADFTAMFDEPDDAPAYSLAVQAGGVYVCPKKDIVCGDAPSRWCDACPLREAQQTERVNVPREATQSMQLAMYRAYDAVDQGRIEDRLMSAVWRAGVAAAPPPAPAVPDNVNEALQRLIENAAAIRKDDAQRLARTAPPPPQQGETR